MRFSSQTFLTGVTTILSLASLGRADGCEKGPFGDSHKFGKKGGGYFCDTAWEKGLVITGLEVWANEWHVKGIQWSYSDGTKSVVRGMNVGDRHQAITWGPEEKITKLQMWGNYEADAVGKIQIETSGGSKLSQGSDTGSHPGESVLTWSGILLGGRGSSNDFVNELEMLFLSDNVKTGGAVVTSVKFPTSIDEWNKKMQGVETVQMDEIYYKNSNVKGNDQKYEFAKSIDMTAGKTMQQSTKNTFGGSVAITVGVEVEVPLFKATDSVTATASYAYEKMNSETESKDKKQTVSWSLSGTLKPGHALKCTAVAMSGVFDSDYESTVSITLASGQKFKVTQPGHFKSTGWSEAVSECKDIPLKDVPDGNETQEIGGVAEKREVKFIA